LRTFVVSDAADASDREGPSDRETLEAGEHRRRKPARSSLAQQLPPGSAGIDYRVIVLDGVDGRERSHVDDETSLHLGLTERRVPLPTCCDPDTVLVTETDHASDVFDRLGSQYCRRQHRHDAANIASDCCAGRLVDDQGSSYGRRVLEDAPASRSVVCHQRSSLIERHGSPP
jgi:hypothetical protein